MTQKIRPRHPEKVKNPINPIKKKPQWIRSKLVNSKEFFITKTIVNQNQLKTVCQEANCPNITECWSKRHATFLIMGDTCTRACAFCDVITGKPKSLDPFEPIKISTAFTSWFEVDSIFLISFASFNEKFSIRSLSAVIFFLESGLIKPIDF